MPSISAILSAVKIGGIAVIVLVVVGCLWYITGLRADLIIAQNNEAELRKAVAEQAQVIEAREKEIDAIQMINTTLSETTITQGKEIENLREKFNKKTDVQKRDFGKITAAKPELVQRLINRATDKVNRCFELITGTEPTKGEINSECQEYLNSLSN